MHDELRAEIESLEEEVSELREAASWTAYGVKSFARAVDGTSPEEVEIPQVLESEEFEEQLPDE